jgi:nicotinic acid phosphoribosyltransferase
MEVAAGRKMHAGIEMGYPALFADLYELTMGQAYRRSGRDGQATFSLFFRGYPSDRGYFVLAGVAEALDYLEGFAFADEDVSYLRSTGKFEAAFLDYPVERSAELQRLLEDVTACLRGRAG